MLINARLLLVAGIALLALAAGSASASAEAIALSPGGAITASSLGKVTFEAAAATVSCNLTLTGSLEPGSIEEREEPELGSISSVRWSSCEGGELRATLSLPWSLTYVTMLGIFPERATGFLFRAERAKLQFILLRTLTCLYEGNFGALTPLRLIERTSETYTTGLIRLLGERMAFSSGSELCPTTGALKGTLTLTAQDARPPGPGIMRLDQDALVIPSEQREGTISVRNSARAGEHALRIASDTPIAPNEMSFSVPTDGCTAGPLRSGAAMSCAIVARFLGGIPRPATTHVRINYADGASTGVIRDFTVRQN